MLDGLDEVREPETRRIQILQIVDDFSASFHRCRIVATSRTYTYQDWMLRGVPRGGAAALHPGQIQRFISTWYAHMAELGRLSAT